MEKGGKARFECFLTFAYIVHIVKDLGDQETSDTYRWYERGYWNKMCRMEWGLGEMRGGKIWGEISNIKDIWKKQLRRQLPQKHPKIHIKNIYKRNSNSYTISMGQYFSQIALTIEKTAKNVRQYINYQWGQRASFLYLIWYLLCCWL